MSEQSPMNDASAMDDPVQQQLLGYLLGALDEVEQREVEERVSSDPVWQEKLAGVRRRFALLLDARREIEPPAGLAARTCQYIWTETRPASAPARKAMSPATAPPSRTSRWSWSDVLVAASVLLIGVSLIGPAIVQARFNSQLISCQENLRGLGVALTRFSEGHGGYFPRVPSEGPTAAAGIYAPTLVDAELLDDVRQVICPGSALAGEGRFELPSLSDLRTMTPDALRRALPTIGGSYGYGLGYVVDGTYHDTKNLRRPYFAILADAPQDASGRRKSLNHGGKGENVLFEDGHVAFMPIVPPESLPDDFYSNDAGLIAPGMHVNDSVVVPSATPPIIGAMK
ncbi:MAG: hypothetical protein ACOY3P_05630 [Planctomycetota bacterium]